MHRRLRSAYRAAVVLTAALACAVASQASGAAGPRLRLYDVQVPLSGTSEPDRAAGFKAALGLLAVRVSGQNDAATNPAVARADPQKYVQRYSMSTDQVLTVGFERQSVGRLLQEAGLPFWPDERPQTFIEAPGVDQDQAQRLADRRGLPIAWGAPGATEGVAGPATAVLQGTPRDGAYDWSFSQAGQTVRARGSLEQGIDLAADTLAARYAPPSTRADSTYTLRVGGISDLAAYASALDYLESLSLVGNVAVEALEGDVLRLRITARGDRQLLGRIAALDGAPLAPDGDGAPGSASDLRYVP